LFKGHPVFEIKIELGITNADIQSSRMAYPAERMSWALQMLIFRAAGWHILLNG